MKHIAIASLTLATALALTLPAVAKSKRMQDTDGQAMESAAASNQGTGGAMKLAERQSGPLSDRIFTREEREKIRDYYRDRRGDNRYGDDNDDGAGKGKNGKEKSKNKGNGKDKGKSNDMPPGLAKRDELPPGLQKQLEKNGKLPPGLEKRDLPGELDERLPRRERRFRRILVDNDVALIDEEQGIVLDIIENVLGGN